MGNQEVGRKKGDDGWEIREGGMKERQRGNEKGRGKGMGTLEE